MEIEDNYNDNDILKEAKDFMDLKKKDNNLNNYLTL